MSHSADPVSGRFNGALWIGLVCLTLVAGGARLVAHQQLSATAFGQHNFLDAAHYDRWAERTAAGDWLAGDRPFFVEPGYLYLVAGIKRLGGNLAAIRLLQALIGTGTVLLTALLARRLGGDTAALGAGLLAALYEPFVHFEGLLLKTTMEVFLAILALHLAVVEGDRDRNRGWLLVGFVAGLATVFKGNFTVVLPLLVLWSAWTRWQQRGRRLWLPPIFILTGIAPLLTLVAIRNHVVSGEWLMLPYSSGINFYIGNGPSADGANPTLGFAAASPANEDLAGKLEAERRAGRRLGYGETSAFWWAETWRTIQDHPTRWLRLMLTKLRLYGHHYEFTDNVSLYFVRARVPIRRWLVVGFQLAGPLGLAGLAFSAVRRDPAQLLVAAYIAVQVAGVVVFHVLDRYRLAAVPAMLALGATALVAAAGGDRRLRLILAAALTTGVIVTNVLPNPVAPLGQNLAGHHEMLGVAALEAHDHTTAAAEFRNTIRLDPRLQSAYFRLAVSLALTGDERASRAATEHGLALDPIGGQYVLAEISAHNRPAAAAAAYERSAALAQHVVESWYGAAAAYHRLARTADAERALQAALAAAPGQPAVLELFGDILAARGEMGRAAEAWKAAQVGNPKSRELEGKLEALRRRVKQRTEVGGDR